ncbi:hypothetical protein HMPREF9969_1455 [Prevotella sp. oral taxon 306 str. F0472]|nr:hypothetical protein HMPREF9969_1455 [Prevotella sp. oral taxon 306 str. F0472]
MFLFILLSKQRGRSVIIRKGSLHDEETPFSHGEGRFFIR